MGTPALEIDIMRKVILATLALSPMLLHAQANSPAQPQASTLQSRLEQPNDFAADRGVTASTPLRVSTGVVAPKLVRATTIASTDEWYTRRSAFDKKVVVEMLVKASKNALAKRKEIYLDSEPNFRDPKNLAVVITEAGADKFKQAGIDDPAVHFKAKTIRVTGTVTLQDQRPRIVVDDPGQIRLFEKK